MLKHFLSFLRRHHSVSIRRKFDFVGPFKPNTFGGGAYAKGIKPEMYAGFESPIPANNTTK